MASRTVNSALFPSGTTVGAYDATGIPSFPDAGPASSAVGTATVSGTSFTFDGLEENRDYFAAAIVGGAWRNITFRTGQETTQSLIVTKDAAEGSLSTLAGKPVNTPTLDDEGKLRESQLPSSVVTDSAYAVSASTWGDSLPWGSVSGVQYDWSVRLSEKLGIPVYNGGVAGQCSSDIAMRQGGLQPLFTVEGNQIPASAAVKVTTLVPATSYRPDSGTNFKFLGTLHGVAGTLEHNHGTHEWTFTRTTAGSVVSCPANTPFIGTEGVGHERDLQIFWGGRNNVNREGVHLLDAVRDTQRMVNHMLGGTARYFVLGVTTTDTEINGTTGHTQVVELNEALKARFGERFIDVRRYLIDHGLEDAGINPTPTDLSRIANDTIPASLWSEGPHLNEAGYNVVCDLIAQKILEWGWVEGRFPVELPAKATTLAHGTATEETVPLTWTTGTGSTGYRVEYRKKGETTWKRGAISATGAATVENLTSEGEYEFRVTSRNVAGYGEVSSTVTATTTGTAPTLISSDEFTRVDGTLGETDAGAGGSKLTYAVVTQPRVVSHHMGRTSSSGTVFGRVTLAEGKTDHRVLYKVVALPSPEVVEGGPICRFEDTTHWYGAMVLFDGSFHLRTGASSTPLASLPPATVKVGDIIGVRAKGTKIQAYLNGVIVMSVTDSSVTAGLGVGARFPNTDEAMALAEFKVYDK